MLLVAFFAGVASSGFVEQPQIFAGIPAPCRVVTGGRVSNQNCDGEKFIGHAVRRDGDKWLVQEEGTADQVRVSCSCLLIEKGLALSYQKNDDAIFLDKSSVKYFALESYSLLSRLACDGAEEAKRSLESKLFPEPSTIAIAHGTKAFDDLKRSLEQLELVALLLNYAELVKQCVPSAASIGQPIAQSSFPATQGFIRKVIAAVDEQLARSATSESPVSSPKVTPLEFSEQPVLFAGVPAPCRVVARRDVKISDRCPGHKGVIGYVVSRQGDKWSVEINGATIPFTCDCLLIDKELADKYSANDKQWSDYFSVKRDHIKNHLTAISPHVNCPEAEAARKNLISLFSSDMQEIKTRSLADVSRRLLDSPDDEAPNLPEETVNEMLKELGTLFGDYKKLVQRCAESAVGGGEGPGDRIVVSTEGVDSHQSGILTKPELPQGVASGGGAKKRPSLDATSGQGGAKREKGTWVGGSVEQDKEQDEFAPARLEWASGSSTTARRKPKSAAKLWKSMTARTSANQSTLLSRGGIAAPAPPDANPIPEPAVVTDSVSDGPQSEPGREPLPNVKDALPSAPGPEVSIPPHINPEASSGDPPVDLRDNVPGEDAGATPSKSIEEPVADQAALKFGEPTSNRPVPDSPTAPKPLGKLQQISEKIKTVWKKLNPAAKGSAVLAASALMMAKLSGHSWGNAVKKGILGAAAGGLFGYLRRG